MSSTTVTVRRTSKRSSISACSCIRNEKAESQGRSLHDNASLREATSISCIFCPCYSVDVLLYGIERILNGHASSEVRHTWHSILLNVPSMLRVFWSVAEHRPDVASHPNYGIYRDQYVCAELLLRIYPRFFEWEAKTPSKASRFTGVGPIEDKEVFPDLARSSSFSLQRDSAMSSNDRFGSIGSTPINKINWWEKTSPVVRTKSPTDSYNCPYAKSPPPSPPPCAAPVKFTRGDASDSEWSEIFLLLYRCLWDNHRLDSILVGFLVKVIRPVSICI
jgi:hypothetical protein